MEMQRWIILNIGLGYTRIPHTINKSRSSTEAE